MEGFGRTQKGFDGLKRIIYKGLNGLEGISKRFEGLWVLERKVSKSFKAPDFGSVLEGFGRTQKGFDGLTGIIYKDLNGLEGFRRVSKGFSV